MFLKDAVDRAYDEAVKKADADQLRIRLSREEAILRNPLILTFACN